MDHYEFDYIGPHVDKLKLTIAAWCEEHGCRLETTALLNGSRFSISGPEDRQRYEQSGYGSVAPPEEKPVGAGTSPSTRSLERASMLLSRHVGEPTRKRTSITPTAGAAFGVLFLRDIEERRGSSTVRRLIHAPLLASSDVVSITAAVHYHLMDADDLVGALHDGVVADYRGAVDMRTAAALHDQQHRRGHFY